MIEAIKELHLSQARLPAVINDSSGDRFRDDFFILCVCHVEILGSRHTILSKRYSKTRGNRPGLMLHIHSARVELLTFGDNDLRWHCLTSKPRSIMPGQRYEILAGRKDGRGIMYVNSYPCVDLANNISSDQPGFAGGISQGDINCDEPMFVGVTHFGGQNWWKFDGSIEFLGIYNSYELPRSLMGYPPRKTWMTQTEFMDRIPPNTKSVFSMKDLGFKVKDNGR